MDTRPALALVPPMAPDAVGSAQGAQLLPGGPVSFPLVGLGTPHPHAGLAAHLAELGPRATPASAAMDDLTGVVAASELTGRGGGHFPVARKWRAVLAATERTGVLPVVVANGSEGEPASAKDAALLCYRPHLVLDGLAEAAAAVRATESVLWLHGDAHAAHRAVVRALEQRRAGGLVEAPVRLATGPSRYLSGESSAVVRALSGGPALPESRRVPTAHSGVGGRPTLVQNVETLARVGLLVRTGVDTDRPTSLVTVVAGGRRTVLEVGPGVTVSEVLALGGWPVGVDPQAVLVGGYGGSWVPFDDARDVPVAETSMQRAGLSLGAGVLAPLSPQACGVAEVARLATYLAGAGARQCGPCLFGLGALSTTLTGLAHGEGRRSDVRRLQGWAAEVVGRGACHHPDGAVRMVLSGLTTFATDVEAHRRGRPCSGVGAAGILPVPDERP